LNGFKKFGNQTVTESVEQEPKSTFEPQAGHSP
jgi:hypothetical protein